MVNRKEIEELTRRKVEPILEELDLELVGIEYLPEGGRWFLRVYIDKPTGVTVDDCEAVSERLSRELDVVDPIPHQYYLEVSSPGAERPLKKESDFVRYAGRLVEVTLYQPLEGQKKWRGHLVGLIDGDIHLRVKDKKGEAQEKVFPRQQVAQVRLAIEF